MPWFKVDDQLPNSRKVLAIPRADRARVMGLWCLAGAWSGAQLSDGLVPTWVIEELCGTLEDAATLERVGLWHGPNDAHCPLDSERCHRPGPSVSGWWFHEWEQQNPTRASTEEKRAGWRDRQAKSRARHANVTRDKTVTTENVTRDTPVSHAEVTQSRPVPSRPDPTTQNTSSTADAIDGEFERFWALYPRKVGKGQAIRAYRTARRKVDQATIAGALHVYKRAAATLPADKIRHAATWLNGEPWHDDPDAIAPANGAGSADWLERAAERARQRMIDRGELPA